MGKLTGRGYAKNFDASAFDDRLRAAAAEAEARWDGICPHGDPFCPCPDGLWCNYKSDPEVTGSPADRCPRTGLFDCMECLD